ncbi:MAG: cobalt ECF transporter T component CbiQ [Deltaproteobacteria bacterium]|nr:cobalt ECF transporter T component CbiQ [Deltaproteobacteria bacterium]
MGHHELMHGIHADANDLAGGHGLHRWDPRLKLGLLATAVGLNVIVAQLWLSSTLFFISVLLAFWSRISLRHFAFFFIAPAWATLVVFVGFSMGFGTTPVWSFGVVQIYREGMYLGLSAASRVVCDMAWLGAVFLTTPFNRVLEALKWFHVPSILVEVMATSYRYAFLLFEEFFKMRDVARIKGGLQTYTMTCRSTALILAQIILRAYDRTNRIQEAMVARGENAIPDGDNMEKFESSSSCPNQCDVTPIYLENCKTVLSCKDAFYSYKGDRALKNISLTLSKGDVMVLCGPNGSGKTTLLKLFAGILPPDSGKITLFGKALDRKARKMAFRHVAFLFQDPNDQLFCTHVCEDIAYGPKNLGIEPAEIDRLVETAMNLMEVSHLAHRPIHRLSHGEMKRVGLAGLIAMRPPLILLDEPTAGLDPASANHLVNLIRHLNSHHGYTLVMVTHDVNVAAALAKRIVILNQGEIVADGSPRDILTDKQLLETARLEPPILTRLFQELLENCQDQGQIPVTIDEAIKILRSTPMGQNCNV